MPGVPSGVHVRTPPWSRTIFELTSRRRAHLRSLAHGLQPVVHVGTGGVTDAVARSLEEALNTRELLKVRVQDGAPDDVRETARQLAAAVAGAHVVQTIGRIAVIYRPDPDEPGIVFPR